MTPDLVGVCAGEGAYLKVHGGPALQCARSSRAVANRGGDGAGDPRGALVLVWGRGRRLVDRGGLATRKWWFFVGVTYHIGGVTYW